MTEGKVTDISSRRNLRPVGNGNGSGGYGERLARIESRLDSIEQHGATKDDISKVKIWVLAGVLGTIPVASVVMLAILRLIEL
ncbi:MAG: hypothetical protein OXC63_05760 [Aestuariivita sp.]|nr:hypothetical protein [Aestuariivita sp.]MCY4346354.1 hypothetical protein [Aestuariivita sp.]